MSEVDATYDIATGGKYNRRGVVYTDRTLNKMLSPSERELLIRHEREEHGLRRQGLSYEDAHKRSVSLAPISHVLEEWKTKRRNDRPPPPGLLMDGARPEIEFAGLGLRWFNPVKNLSEKGSDLLKALRLSGQPYEEKTIVAGFEKFRLIKPMICTKCRKTSQAGDIVLRHESGSKHCPICGGELKYVS